jgi:acyl-CoA synthetase (AMP-forming)/AMP-acid ligase II
MAANPYAQGLGRRAANSVLLTPLSFLVRSARVYPDPIAVVHGARRHGRAQTARAVAGWPRRHGGAMLADTPGMIDAHFGVPMAGGGFHGGDLAVVHPDGYVEIRDRSKDIIFSGGENTSSLEVEDVPDRHPAALACAVVARPDPT